MEPAQKGVYFRVFQEYFFTNLVNLGFIDTLCNRLHPQELLTRERLLDEVWGWDYRAGTRTVDIRIAELRKALGVNPHRIPITSKPSPVRGTASLAKYKKQHEKIPDISKIGKSFYLLD